MKKILIIGFVWPEPTTTAAGLRMVQLIESFKSFGWSVTFASTATKTDFSMNLEQLGVETIAVQLNHLSFDEFVLNLQPDFVVFDRFIVEEQFAWRVAEQIPNAIRILNTEDLHSLRKTRETHHNKGEDFTLYSWKQSDMTKREIASIYRSDLSLMVSTFEMNLLKEEIRIPENLLMHLPFMLDLIDKQDEDKWPGFEERTDFITYGNGKHAPNVDSIIYLKQVLWPKIRQKLPKVNLKIYGAYFPQHIEQMHNPNEGFYVLGWAKDLNTIIQKSRVVLAPLRFGAGIKGKITEAMNNGTPVVSTHIGMEGMGLDSLLQDCTSQSNSEAFVQMAIKLYLDKDLWQKTQTDGIRLVNSKFSKGQHQERLKSRLLGISKDLKLHRSQNFIGSLLQHQTASATKYMGKWIEEKNRK